MKLMEQKITSENCHCRFAAIGSAFFCPACGHNSASSTFNDTLDTILNTLESAGEIRTFLSASSGHDLAENTIRHLFEDSLVRIAASFQRFAEAKFLSLSNSSDFSLSKNVFQRLKQSSELWRQAIGKGYEDMLSSDEWIDLNRLFQQRHLLAHREGIVDQEYIDKSQDHSISVGQKLVIKAESPKRLAEIVRKISTHLP